MSRLEIPALVLAVATATRRAENPADLDREAHGFLLARSVDPATIICATGPGKDPESGPDDTSSTLDNSMRQALRRQGLAVVGSWHSHSAQRGHGQYASLDDRADWIRCLAADPSLDTWTALILTRAVDRWAGVVGYQLHRGEGVADLVLTTPIADLHEEAGQLMHTVKRGPLVDGWWRDGAVGDELLLIASDRLTRASVAAGGSRRDTRPPAGATPAGSVHRRGCGTIVAVH